MLYVVLITNLYMPLITNGQLVTDETRYLMTGLSSSCSDYDGYEEITSQGVCTIAANKLNLATTDIDIDESPGYTSPYPRYCSWSTHSGLLWNPDERSPTYTKQGQNVLCKSKAGVKPNVCAGQASNTVNITSVNVNDSSIFTCSNNWTFTDFDRVAYMYFNYNPTLNDYPWGVQKWKLDVMDSTYYETLYYKTTDGDTMNGLAIDNSRDLLYTFIEHRFGTDSRYERWLVSIDINTASATYLLHDYWPYHCYHLGASNENKPRENSDVMSVDENNNILYWINQNKNNNMTLYSLDMTLSPFVVKVEIMFEFDDNVSQMTIDCNGNIWFTHSEYGLYLYKPGWNKALIILSEPQLNGIQLVRRDGSNMMDVLISNLFSIRNYTDIYLQIYTDYPISVQQETVDDIIYNLFYDYQNHKMCIWAKNSVVPDMYMFCYDPNEDPNDIWNYVSGTYVTSMVGLVIRFGEYNDISESSDVEYKYFMVNEYESCTDYKDDGAQEIMSLKECLHAIVALKIADTCNFVNESASSTLPRYCYFDTTGSSCNDKIYFNPTDNSMRSGSETILPLCKILLKDGSIDSDSAIFRNILNSIILCVISILSLV
eukprot:244734_1